MDKFVTENKPKKQDTASGECPEQFIGPYEGFVHHLPLLRTELKGNGSPTKQHAVSDTDMEVVIEESYSCTGGGVETDGNDRMVV